MTTEVSEKWVGHVSHSYVTLEWHKHFLAHMTYEQAKTFVEDCVFNGLLCAEGVTSGDGFILLQPRKVSRNRKGLPEFPIKCRQVRRAEQYLFLHDVNPDNHRQPVGLSMTDDNPKFKGTPDNELPALVPLGDIIHIRWDHMSRPNSQDDFRNTEKGLLELLRDGSIYLVHPETGRYIDYSNYAGHYLPTSRYSMKREDLIRAECLLGFRELNITKVQETTTIGDKRLEIEDFISLERLSEKMAESWDDHPDLYATLQKCMRDRVRVVYWHHCSIPVLRHDKPVNWDNKLPVGVPEILEYRRNYFFLNNTCLSKLLRAEGQSIRCREFSAEGVCTGNADDPIEMLSTLELERMDHNQKIDSLLRVYDVDSERDLPERERKYLSDLHEIISGYPEDDGYLEFGITQVKILREDMGKLGFNLPKEVGVANEKETQHLTAKPLVKLKKEAEGMGVNSPYMATLLKTMEGYKCKGGYSITFPELWGMDREDRGYPDEMRKAAKQGFNKRFEEIQAHNDTE